MITYRFVSKRTPDAMVIEAFCLTFCIEIPYWRGTSHSIMTTLLISRKEMWNEKKLKAHSKRQASRKCSPIWELLTKNLIKTTEGSKSILGADFCGRLSCTNLETFKTIVSFDERTPKLAQRTVDDEK